MLCAVGTNGSSLASRPAGARLHGSRHALRCSRISNKVQAVIDTTVERFGQVDILVNNAGVSWGERPETMTLAQWQKVIDTNLTGAFIFSQAAGREMLKRQLRRIITSGLDCRSCRERQRTVLRRLRGKQSGLMGLTRELAASWGRHGIRVQRHRSRVLPVAHVGGLHQDWSRGIKKTTPLGRVGQPVN
jgi:gluconate 5-dehydrogenase